MIGWLEWTASSILTPSLSDPDGPVSPSTYTPAFKLYFPSNFPSRRQSILINKPHSEDAVHLGEH
jgi:hypothetical protein